MGTEIYSLGYNDYPVLLREIDDAPERVYVRGTLPPHNHIMLCVVGSRKYTTYGKTTCEQLIAGLSGFPLTVVSGLALGIDSIAHRSALNAGINTCAVPGSGLANTSIAPRSHLSLAQTIISKGGCLLSEYEPDFQATPWSFPRRNRIMAGLSHAVLIIEATKKSGTLITARLATEYNRSVLTVPGSIFSASAHGPHDLIRDGATPITSPSDLIEALDLSSDTCEAPQKTKNNYDDCTDHELRVISLLHEPRHREDVIRDCDLSVAEINTALSLLEMKGYIREDMGYITLYT